MQNSSSLAAYNQTASVQNVTSAMQNSSPLPLDGQISSLPNDTDVWQNSTLFARDSQTSFFLNVTDTILNSTSAVYHTVLPYYLYEAHLFLKSVIPIITSVGFVGNSLSFVILVQLAKTSSFYIYLAALALTDSALAVAGIFQWLILTGYYNPFKSVAQHVCSALFATYVILTQLSAWIIVTAKTDRYIAVCHPFKVRKYCTKKRALVYIGAVFAVLISLNFPVICFESNDDYSTCLSPEITNDYCLKYWHVIEFMTYILVPVFLICFCNTLIVRELYKASKRRRELRSGDAIAASTTPQPKDSTRRTTFTLFAVTAVFFLSVIPLVYIALYAMITDQTYEEAVVYMPNLSVLSNLFPLLNHSLNFILYGLTGKVYRDKLCSFCRFCRRP